MPEIKECEAVALSLNIEPEKIKYEQNGWMGAEHPFDESEEFIDRLTILKKYSSNRAHFPTPCKLNMANWYECELRLDEFAAWCIHVGFEIPPELSVLSKAATPKTEAPAAAMVETVTVTQPAPAASIEAWRTEARKIGEAIYNKKPTLNIEQIADKVHTEMTKRHEGKEANMTGRGEKVPSAASIKRHALTGLKS